MHLKKWREKNELSQNEFAESINVTQQAVSEWESGDRKPNLQTILKIMAFTNNAVMPADFR